MKKVREVRKGAKTLNEKIADAFGNQGHAINQDKAADIKLLEDYNKLIYPWMTQLITEVMFRGKTLKQAARIVEKDEKEVRNFWYNNPICKKLIKEAFSNFNLNDIRFRLKASTERALDILLEIMNDIADNGVQTRALRARIAMEILTQAGVPEAKEFKFKVEHEYKNLIRVIEEVSNDFEKPKEIDYEEAKFEESGEQGIEVTQSESSSGNAEVSTSSKSPQPFDVTKMMIREVRI